MFFALHIFLMAISTLGILAGVGAAMFFRSHKNWLKIHKTINSSSILLAVAGIFSAFIYTMNSSAKHLSGLHPWIGLAAALSTAAAFLLGFYQFKAKNKPAARTAHRFGGRLGVVMLLTAVILGLKLIHVI